MWWVAEDDPIRFEKLQIMSMMEYLFLLNKKIGDALKPVHGR